MFETGSNGQVANIIAIFLLGILYGVFLIDFIMSLGLFSKIRIVIQGSTVIHRYESIRDLTKKKILENKIKIMGKILESFKAKNEERKQKEAAFKNSKFYKTVLKIIYIDPDKRGTKKNYDKDGHPIKEE